ncbi:hypothetical protein [Myroides odoratus]|uniref:hypothetical protein n=1 Tax=Myroides odoratus TaxID=256 RepID=UPI0033415A8D
MKRILLFLFMGFSLLTCKRDLKEKEQQIDEQQIDEQQNNEKEKIHWYNKPKYIDDTEPDVREVLEMRTKKNQEKIAMLWKAFSRIEKKDSTEDYLTMEEVNLTNDLYYEALKSRGFRFPSEEVFSKQIKKIFNVDIYADYADNPRIVRKGDFLILCSKIYLPEYRQRVPTLDFADNTFIFDLKRRFLTEIDTINGIVSAEVDDYGEEYNIYWSNSLAISYNNYIFYNSKTALNDAYDYLPSDLVDIGYEDFPPNYPDVYKRIQIKYMDEYKKRSSRSREGWDYRMYDRLFFSRGFDGKLIVKKKMLAAAVELAKEDEAYIRVPLDYYFIQMTTPYVANEYAADYSEVDNYFTQREPYYTPEERAMIWVYTSLLELHLPPSEKLPAPNMFIGLTLNYPELAKVAEEHNYFGEDMEEVLNIIDRTNGWW